MEKFNTLSAIACPLGLENVDTDQLIPARFMSRPRSAGYGGFLLHDLRCDETGEPHGRFVLDQRRYLGSRIIVARRNFGTGSSREAAVYALWDYGIRCVIAPSFGGIFEANAAKNGLLTAIVDEAGIADIEHWLEAVPRPQLSVDLEHQTITMNGHRISFAIDPVRRLRLMNGWDDLDFTDRHSADIAEYRARRLKTEPWLYPARRHEPDHG